MSIQEVVTLAIATPIHVPATIIHILIGALIIISMWYLMDLIEWVYSKRSR